MEIHLLFYLCISFVNMGCQAWRDIFDRARGRQHPPIDGSWSSWQQWSSCYKNIGRNSKLSLTPGGHPFFLQWEGFDIQSRNRTCTNPKPLFGGKQCEPPLHRFQQCSCSNPLLGAQRIPDSRLSASSSLDGYPAQEVRLGNISSVGWCTQPAQSFFTDTYIQIDFQNFTTVGAISTIDNMKGRVVLYKLKYSLNGKTWIFIHNDKNEQAFVGNYLRGTWKKNNFSSRHVMRYLRLIPVQHYDLPCLKMEVYGCVFTCGSTLTAPFGKLIASSSAYYDQNCLWTIDVLNATSLTFEFNIFYVPCADGFIDFYDRRDNKFVNASLLKRVCLHDGSNQIPNLILNRNSVWVNFVSNSSDTELNFNIRYSSQCFQTVHLIRGKLVHITSPNFPDSYGNNLNCAWTLIPPSSSEVVEVTVNHFSVDSGQSGGKCDRNVVKIITENGDLKKNLATYCNNNKPPVAPEKINIKAEKIVISFKSDSFISDNGFDFSVISGVILPTSSNGEDKIIHIVKTEKLNGSRKNINSLSERNFNSTGIKKIRRNKDDTWTVIIICTFSSLVVVLIGIVLYSNCRRFITNRNELIAAEEYYQKKGKNKNEKNEMHGLLSPPTSASPSKVKYIRSPEEVILRTTNSDVEEDISEPIETAVDHAKSMYSDIDNEMLHSPDQVDGAGESISYDRSTPSSSPVKTIVISYSSPVNKQHEESISTI